MALKNTVPSGNASASQCRVSIFVQCQVNNYGAVEKYVCVCIMHMYAKVIRKARAKFHCNNLPLYKTFKIASLIFWHTLYIYLKVLKKTV